jgi:hypothetical protein
MNQYIKSQIENMTTMTKAFSDGCHLAAIQNDGTISKEEAKALKRIDAAVQRFIKEINSVVKE